jgi:hypothetical protein
MQANHFTGVCASPNSDARIFSVLRQLFSRCCSTDFHVPVVGALRLPCLTRKVNERKLVKDKIGFVIVLLHSPHQAGPLSEVLTPRLTQSAAV